MTQGKTWKSLNTFDYQALVFGWICSIGVIDVQGSGAVSAVETAGGIIQQVTKLSSVVSGDETVTSDMVVFDKTYTRKYFGVQVTEKYIMNVLQSGKVIYKHTYSRKFPGDPIPFTSSSSENWEYNYGGTVLGDHQIEVRDFVCKRGDYSGMDEELKVSFTIGILHSTTRALISNRSAQVAILDWDLEPSDCREASVFNGSNGLPIFGTVLPISWYSTIRANGRGQVRVYPNLPSFTVNRSWGARGSMSVTCE